MGQSRRRVACRASYRPLVVVAVTGDVVDRKGKAGSQVGPCKYFKTMYIVFQTKFARLLSGSGSDGSDDGSGDGSGGKVCKWLWPMIQLELMRSLATVCIKKSLVITVYDGVHFLIELIESSGTFSARLVKYSSFVQSRHLHLLPPARYVLRHYSGSESIQFHVPH